MTTEADIERALFWRLAFLGVDNGGVDFTPHSDLAPFSDEALYQQPTVAPMAWPNRPFVPPQGIYLRVDHFRNRNERVFVLGSDPHKRQGILQVTVVSPLREGPSPATERADEVAAHFPADLDLFRNSVRVRVQAAPDVMSAMKQDASWNVAVSVRYESYS